MVTNDIAAVEGTAAPRKRARRNTRARTTNKNATKAAASDHTPLKAGSLTIPSAFMTPGGLAFKKVLAAYPGITVENYIEQLKPVLNLVG